MNSVCERADDQYFALVNDILLQGVPKESRAGNVISTFGKQITIDMSYGYPLLTTKKVFYKGILHELIWFLHGDTNIKYLLENNVHIWDGDAYRFFNELFPENGITKEKFLEMVMNKKFMNHDYTCGDLGPVYGAQWRGKTVFQPIDQIWKVIRDLKKYPDNRRLIVSAWIPMALSSMALPPCHVMFQFYTRKLTMAERLHALCERTNEFDEWKSPTEATLDMHNAPKRAISLMWTQRSVDVPCGLPFNIASYAALLCIVGKIVNMVPERLVGSLGDCHIYENQLDGIKEQLERDTKKYSYPRFVIRDKEWKDDLSDLEYEDMSVEGYHSYDAIKFPLNVG